MPAKGKQKAGLKKAVKTKKSSLKEEVEVDEAEKIPVAASEDVEMSTISQVAEVVQDVVEAAGAFLEEITPNIASSSTPAAETLSMPIEDRKARMEALRSKMHSSTQANRGALVEEASKAKITARSLALMEKQRKLAETLRQRAEAGDKGGDGDDGNAAEREKNWEWTIEDNDNWEKKKARKARRADYEFHDDAHAARRRYKKDLDKIQPDLVSYNRQKEIALGLAPGSLVAAPGSSSSSSSSALVQLPSSAQQQLAAEHLYRDANSMLYGDNKPSEDAIDRVVGKINQDIDKKGKFSRKRVNEAEGDITYINEHNRVFNKKIARYFDKYTTEIRASFERGTAL